MCAFTGIFDILKFCTCCTTVASLYWHTKKLPSTSLVKMAQGTFIEAQITNMEIICHAHMEGRWYTGRKLYQIWADWAVHARCYLQKGMTFHFNIGDFGFLKDGLSHFYQWSAWQLFFVSVQPRNSSGKRHNLNYFFRNSICVWILRRVASE